MMGGSNVVPLQTDPPHKVVPLEATAAHARFYSDWRHLDAFRTLSLVQRVILQDVLMNFSKVAGNEVRLTSTRTMQKYHIGRGKAREAIAGLEERGWIERIGLTSGPSGQAGGNYKILCLNARGQRVSGPYMRWTCDSSS